jgi:DNA-binding transcriptional MerR regulator
MTVNHADRLSLDELATLADLPRRTVRFYIQEGLVERPEGARRGAYYTREHLDQLLTIRKWQRAGLSLERIRELAAKPAEGIDLPPERSRRPGDITVRSHVLLRPGVELIIEPREAGLTPEEVRALVRQATALFNRLKKETGR